MYNNNTTRRVIKALLAAPLKVLGATEAQISEFLDSLEGIMFLRLDKAVDSAANTNTASLYFWRNATGRTLEVKSASYVPQGALTAHDTNYATLALEKADGAGGSVTTVASVATTTTGSGDFANGISEDLAIVGAAKTVAPGEVLAVSITKAGTGVAVPAGAWAIDLAPYGN